MHATPLPRTPCAPIYLATSNILDPPFYSNLDPPLNTATVSDVPWVVDSDWIIASVLRICRRRENASLTTIVGETLLG